MRLGAPASSESSFLETAARAERAGPLLSGQRSRAQAAVRETPGPVAPRQPGAGATMVSAQDAREQRQGCYSCSAVLCTLGGILILILMPMRAPASADEPALRSPRLAGIVARRRRRSGAAATAGPRTTPAGSAPRRVAAAPRPLIIPSSEGRRATPARRSWVKVEYYQGCLKTQRSTGKVDRSTVWRTGNHLIGPDYVFRCYEISSQNFNERLSVWSRSSESDAGSSLELDVSFQYTMDVKRLGDLYSKVALDFEGLVASKAIDALKNTAPLFGVDQFLTQRPLIEATLMRNVSSAIEDIFARVVSFELRDVRPEDEYQRARLAAAIQEESNAKELYSQQATLVRERTAVEVQQVENDAVSVRAAATAEASYRRLSGTRRDEARLG